MIAFGTWTTSFNKKLQLIWLKSPLLLLLEKNLVQIDNLARLPERHAQSMMTTSHFQYTQMVTTASLHPRLTRLLHNQMMSTTSPQMMQLLRIRMGPPCPT